uniref:Aldo_ket_red domain-containing protein n=1 Tax=Mesocestoides corti TaxID=53468 RepID=A0A5K3FT93_MESCO
MEICTIPPAVNQIEVSLNEEPLVKAIADAHKKTTAQILIRHALQRGLAVICKIVTNSRIKSNFEVFDFELTDAEMMRLNASGRNARIFRHIA